MKKFKFRLEPLLRLKEHQEKDKQKSLAFAAQKVFAQEEHLRQIVHKRFETQESQRESLTGHLNPGHLLICSRYLGKLKMNELTGREILKAFIVDRERKRLELVEATKQKKIFEKLKERRRNNYMADNERIMQKEQDDIAAKLFLQNKGSRSTREPWG